jgi:hypothetical protein
LRAEMTQTMTAAIAKVVSTLNKEWADTRSHASVSAVDMPAWALLGPASWATVFSTTR